jgi:hypothetical protein
VAETNFRSRKLFFSSKLFRAVFVFVCVISWIVGLLSDGTRSTKQHECDERHKHEKRSTIDL